MTYHVAAGSKSFVPRAVLATAEKAADSVPNGRPRDQFLAFLKSSEFQDGLGDGAVAVKDALLPGVKSRRTFDLNHLELVTLPGEQPEQCEVFQWIMATLGWRRL